MKVLVLGITGMLGNAMFRVLSENPALDVFGTVRSGTHNQKFPAKLQEKIRAGVDVDNQDSLVNIYASVKPDVVVNCIGLVKQLADANDPLSAIPINALLPHRLAQLCKINGARLVHISTDCVFSGSKGRYIESDFADADDLYGRSKFLGEVTESQTITLRTSIIGHELNGHRSLVDWFLAQKDAAKGYSRAIFSGLPTVELATIVRDKVLPNPNLHGLYHVAAAPINKFELLTLIANVYGKKIVITPSEELIIDRSLNADRFNQAFDYSPPPWQVLIERMFQFK
jgi:dTDP-4-dehydrorhamnose reductase